LEEEEKKSHLLPEFVVTQPQSRGIKTVLHVARRLSQVQGFEET
jgi:hypothetical protein